MKPIICSLLCLFFFVIHNVEAQPGKKKDKGNKHSAHASAKGNQKHGGGPPPWAPAHGYRAKTRHIYFPQYQTYYDVRKGIYISNRNGKWEFEVNLPSPLTGVDLNVAQKIELELDTDHPEKYFNEHKVKYPKNRKK